MASRPFDLNNANSSTLELSAPPRRWTFSRSSSWPSIRTSSTMRTRARYGRIVGPVESIRAALRMPHRRRADVFAAMMLLSSNSLEDRKNSAPAGLEDLVNRLTSRRCGSKRARQLHCRRLRDVLLEELGVEPAQIEKKARRGPVERESQPDNGGHAI